MIVTYSGPRGRITRIGAHDVDVTPGAPVELPDELAAHLIATYPGEWTEQAPPKPKTPKATTSDDADKEIPS